MRAGRKGLPGDIMNIKDKEIKSIKRGQCVFRQKGRLTACTWKDKKFVHLLTTMPATSECSTVTRAVKEKGKWVQKEVQRPAIVELYNKFMGGVDLADQRVRSYQRNTKTYVWYMKLFFYFVEVAIMNAYLLERKSPHHNPPATQKARLMLPFCRELIKKLIGGRFYRRKQQNNPQSLPDEGFNLSLGHFPVTMPTDPTAKCICSVLIPNMHVLFATLECVPLLVSRGFTPWRTISMMTKTVVMLMWSGEQGVADPETEQGVALAFRLIG